MLAFSARKQNPAAGLTLIEVMIAMALLAFLSLAIYQATTRSFDINFRIGAESNEYTALALSLSAVETDLAQIYSPALDPAITASKEETNNSEFWSARLKTDGTRRSRVKGTRERLTFVTNGNRRMEEGSPQSEFAKITWEIARNESGAYSLYRTVDWDVYEYEEGAAKKAPRVALLENLTSARFSYYRKENRTWEDTWDSESEYAKADGRYPELLTLKIEVPDPANTSVSQAWEVTVKPNLLLNGNPRPQETELVGE